MIQIHHCRAAYIDTETQIFIKIGACWNFDLTDDETGETVTLGVSKTFAIPVTATWDATNSSMVLVRLASDRTYTPSFTNRTGAYTDGKYISGVSINILPAFLLS